MSFDALPESLRADLPADPLPVAAKWRELVGDFVPADVARHQPRDGGFLVSDPTEWLAADNVFEAVLQNCQAGVPLREPLLQAMTLTFFLTEIPHEGDCLMVHFPNKSDTGVVVNWSHEEGFWGDPIAGDIASVLRFMEVSDGNTGEETGAQRLAPTENRLNLDTWPFSFLFENLVEDEVVDWEDGGEFEPPQCAISNFQARCWWVTGALLGLDIPDDHLRNHLTWEPTNALAGEWLPVYAPTALYWLWRSYLLDDTWLDDVLDAVRESPSRLIRDAAKLVDVLRSGARREVGGFDLVAAAERVREIAARLNNPFPEQLQVGPLTFVRDDSLLPSLVQAPPAPPVPPPAPAEGQPLSPWWPDNASPLTASPIPGRVLVAGHRAHPRAGRHASIPNHITSVFEIDENGTVTMTCDTELTTTARFINENVFVLANANGFSLYERKGVFGVKTQTGPNSQLNTTWSADAKTLIRAGGFMNYQLQRMDPKFVDIFRVDGRHVRLVGSAELALPDVQVFADHAVAGNHEEGVAYRIDGLDALAETDAKAPVMLKSMAHKPKLEARTGPQPALEGLNPLGDWGIGSPSGHVAILQHVGGPTFKVLVGDQTGRRPAEPDITATVESGFFDDQTYAAFTEKGEVWAVDLPSGQATKLAATHPPGLWDNVVLADYTIAQIVGENLELRRRQGDAYKTQVFPVGPGAKLLGAIHDQRVLAMSGQDSGLVLLAVQPDGVRLLGAFERYGAFADAKVEVYENPRCFPRIEVEHGGNKYGVGGLDAALADIESYPIVEALTQFPWQTRKLA